MNDVDRQAVRVSPPNPPKQAAVKIMVVAVALPLVVDAAVLGVRSGSADNSFITSLTA